MIETAPEIVDRGKQLTKASDFFQRADRRLRAGTPWIIENKADRTQEVFFLSPHRVFGLYVAQRNLAKDIQNS